MKKAHIRPLAVSVLHYATVTSIPLLHDVCRRLYYIPVGLAAVWFGVRGGLVASAAALHAPHIPLHWQYAGREIANQFVEIAQYKEDSPANPPKAELFEILLNLLLNAVQSTKPGGEIRVRGGAREGLVKGLEYRDVDGRLVEIVVEDEDPGLPEEDLAKVFPPSEVPDRDDRLRNAPREDAACSARPGSGTLGPGRCRAALTRGDSATPSRWRLATVDGVPA